MALGPYFQSTPVSKSGADLDDRIQRLVDAMQEQYLRREGKPLDRVEALRRVMREHPALAAEFHKNSYENRSGIHRR